MNATLPDSIRSSSLVQLDKVSEVISSTNVQKYNVRFGAVRGNRLTTGAMWHNNSEYKGDIQYSELAQLDRVSEVISSTNIRSYDVRFGAIRKGRLTTSTLWRDSKSSEHTKTFCKKFLETIEVDDFEFGLSSQCENLTRKWLQEAPMLTREALNDLYLRNIANEKVLLALLKVIAHFDYDEVFPVGQTMALAAISHKSVEVKECGIRAYENWEHTESLAILGQTEVQPSWLNQYLLDVVSDLKESIGAASS